MSSDPIESALTSLQDLDHPVFSTHGPMAIEALEALGYSDRAPAWARDYAAAQQLEPVSAERASRVASIEQEIAARPWQEVLRDRLPALLPAISCEAAHGVIRTAHAVRSLTRSDSPSRRHELAEALGYWSATWETLPGTLGSGSARLACEALSKVPTIPLSEQAYTGSITDRLRALDGLRGFEEAVSSVVPSDDFVRFADDLSGIAARLYLANAPRARVIDFIHAVDGVYAIRELLPHLDADGSREALFYGWQTVAALHASAGGPLEPAHLEPVDEARFPELIARAVEIGGAHAIKFAQACLAEHATQPDPVFPAALADAVDRMGELKEQRGLVI